jgi:effector-binding domain-containing protein
MHKLLYVTGATLVVLLLVGLLLPAETSFVISRPVSAPAATVFALIDTPRRSYQWSRIRDTDPDAQVRFPGPYRGEGAALAWDGLLGGSGIEIITASEPYRSVTKVVNPGEASEAFIHYDVDPAADGSSVTLRYTHDYGLNIVGRYMGPLLARILRRDHAAGLDELTALAESLPGADFAPLDIEHVDVEPVRMAWLPTSSEASAAAVSDALGDAYFRILNVLRANGLQAAGPPLSILHEFSGTRRLFDAAIPLGATGDVELRDADGVRVGLSPGGPAVRARHTGRYRGLREAHRRVIAYLAAYGLEIDGDPWEVYVSDPASIAEQERLTEIYYPLRADPR